MRRPTLSLVLPLRNEAEELKDLETHLSSWLSAYEIECEIVLVDDGSTDDTRTRIEAWASRDGRVKVISLLRSYGLEAALRAGIDHAAGEAIVLIDGDIQDSAEVIPRMIEQWRAGSDLVHARRRPTKVERGMKSWLRRSIHELTDSLTRNGVPQDAGDFRLVDQGVAARLKNATDGSRHLRGLLGHFARAQSSVTFESLPSRRRKPLSLVAEVDSAFESITRRSLVPIRLAYVAAAFLFGAGLLALTLMLLIVLVSHTPIRSWLWISAILGILTGVQLFFVGLVGEYIGRIFLDQQKLPGYGLAAADAIRERAVPAAPRLAMPSETESLNDSELEPVAAATHTEPPPRPRASTPPPRLTPPPGQVRAISTKSTVKINHEPSKEAFKTEPPPKLENKEPAEVKPGRQDTVKLGESAKPAEVKPVETKGGTRPSNPPLPSKRSSVPPISGNKASKDTKDAKDADGKDNKTPSDKPPASFMTNAAPNSVNTRTKTLAGIPLPAMLAYAAENKSDSTAPASIRGSSPPAAGNLVPAPVSPADVDRLKEDPKPLTTLHGVPGAEKS